MSAFKQKLARIGATAGVLVASTAAFMAVGGVSAGSALALGTQCSGANIKGEGSTLQTKAQTIWEGSAESKGFNGSTNAAACSGTQGSKAKPTVTYTGTGSGAGMEAWGLNSSELKRSEENYIGTDEAPAGPVGTSGTQLNQIRAGLRTKSATTNVAVIPVTQTAIAIVANPPTNCSFKEGITNEGLEKAFNGKGGTWASIGAEGTGCTASLTRVVRFDESGTSYQFKHYLSKLPGGSSSFCTSVYGSKKWSELQSASASLGTTPNQTWPNCEESSSTLVRPAAGGGGEEVKKVNTTTGSIGYAALADAENNITGTTVILKVQNGEVSGKPTFATPALTSTKTANCANVAYNLPKNESGTVFSTWSEAGTHANADWSEVYGSNPEITGTKYPICALTWDLAATNSTGVFGSSIAQTVSDYLKYVVSSTGGQADIAGQWYQVLPSNSGNEVQSAAEMAVTLIG
jgi:hypothetical protein